MILQSKPRGLPQADKGDLPEEVLSGSLFPTVQTRSKAPAVFCQPRTPGSAGLQGGMPGSRALKQERAAHLASSLSLPDQLSSCAN